MKSGIAKTVVASVIAGLIVYAITNRLNGTRTHKAGVLA